MISNNSAFKILIVEDDPLIAGAINDHLKSWGYDTLSVSDFQDVLNVFSDYAPHLVLMDISLPFFNGYHWCSQIRQESNIPIIFISSSGDNMNIIMAMNMGGDDFITKPFDLDVLTAKVQALLRRSYDFISPHAIIEHRGAALHIDDASFSYGGERIDLSKNEYRILQVLLENKGTVVSRDILMKKLWETDSFIDENTLTVNINRLRKRLDQAGLKGFITTKRGLGYLVE